MPHDSAVLILILICFQLMASFFEEALNFDRTCIFTRQYWLSDWSWECCSILLHENNLCGRPIFTAFSMHCHTKHLIAQVMQQEPTNSTSSCTSRSQPAHCANARPKSPNTLRCRRPMTPDVPHGGLISDSDCMVRAIK